MKDPASILVFRNGSIGNTLMAVPALRALRMSFPNAPITIIVDQIGRDLLFHCPYVDELLVYEKRGQDAGLSGFLRIVGKARKTAPSHAILFKRFYRNGLIAFLSGAKVRVGFKTNGKAPFLNQTCPYDMQTHVAHLNLRLVELIGGTTQGDELEVFLSDEDHLKAEEWCAKHNLEQGGFVCAHYGGVTVSAEFMRTEVFAEFLARTCGERNVVLIGSGSSEMEWAHLISKKYDRSFVAVDLPLRTTIALVSRSAAFVGFNSGPAHLAAACKRPGLVISPHDIYEKERVRWRPLYDALRIYPAWRDQTVDAWREWISEAPVLIP
ncbi:hypothetical protein KJZ99_02225 [bacterium]|nr:hypothetical protein [bacterium]